jgi:hypothetical protein
LESYPILNFLVRRGAFLAVALAASTFVVGVIAAVGQNRSTWAIAGAAGGVVVYGFVASYVELVRLITDILVPK